MPQISASLLTFTHLPNDSIYSSRALALHGLVLTHQTRAHSLLNSSRRRHLPAHSPALRIVRSPAHSPCTPRPDPWSNLFWRTMSYPSLVAAAPPTLTVPDPLTDELKNAVRALGDPAEWLDAFKAVIAAESLFGVRASRWWMLNLLLRNRQYAMPAAGDDAVLRMDQYYERNGRILERFPPQMALYRRYEQCLGKKWYLRTTSALHCTIS